MPQSIPDILKKRYDLVDLQLPERLSGAWVAARKNNRMGDERTRDGCAMGQSALIGGFRKVKKGTLRYDGRLWTCKDLSCLNGYYVKITHKDWMGLTCAIFNGPRLTEVKAP